MKNYIINYILEDKITIKQFKTRATNVLSAVGNYSNDGLDVLSIIKIEEVF